MFKKVWYLLVVLVIGMSVGVFLGCDASGGDGDGSIYGTWTSTYGEVFIITDTEFISKFGDFVWYAGTIVNIREDGPGAGYITIIYTECDPVSIGKYYVIHYKDLGSKSVSLSGAGSATDPDFDNWAPGGKILREDAEAIYTVTNGYFNDYSALTKTKK